MAVKEAASRRCYRASRRRRAQLYGGGRRQAAPLSGDNRTKPNAGRQSARRCADVLDCPTAHRLSLTATATPPARRLSSLSATWARRIHPPPRTTTRIQRSHMIDGHHSGEHEVHHIHKPDLNPKPSINLNPNPDSGRHVGDVSFV